MKEIRISEEGNPQGAEKKRNLFLRPLPRWIWLGSLIIIFLAGIFFACWILGSNDFFQFLKNKSGYEFEEVDLNDTECPLDGVMTTKENAERRPLGVVVENHPQARPQSGLDKASFVFEIPSEGGITRFLAFFVENDVEKIGPVRSARTYFIDWAQELKSVYAHCGGSAPALSRLKGINASAICDINQFFYGSYFWRDKERFAPHNLYTDTDKLRKASVNRGCDQKGDYEEYKFKEDVETGIRPTEQTLTINFSGPDYVVTYRYDKENNRYLRELAGSAHLDKINGNQIAPKTVVVMKTARSVYYQNGVELWKVTTTGTGNAEIFMDGQKVVCTWKRSSLSERTRFYDSSGQEIIFNRGQIWVEVVSPGMSVTSAP